MEAVVLVSGGLDSAVCLAKAVELYGNDAVMAVSMFYGQTHSKELECAKKITEHYKVKHLVRDLSAVFEFSDCSLLKTNDKEIAHGSYAEQQAVEGIAEGAVATYVPFRNGLFLSYVAAIAYSVGAKKIYYGAHADDSAGNAYPDCSDEFYDLMNKAIYIGTGSKVSLEAPFIDINKAGVVKVGLELNVPFQLTWSCYEGGDKACGECGTCIDRLEAFRSNNMEDPIAYKKPMYRYVGTDIIFDRDYLANEIDPISFAVDDQVVDTSRWSAHHKLVFAFRDKFYETYYSIGATELQDEVPWGGEENVRCYEVKLGEVTKQEWIPVES